MSSNGINFKSNKKVEDSNNKRLESLREKLDEFKNKKAIIKSSLNLLVNLFEY